MWHLCVSSIRDRRVTSCDSSAWSSDKHRGVRMTTSRRLLMVFLCISAVEKSTSWHTSRMMMNRSKLGSTQEPAMETKTVKSVVTNQLIAQTKDSSKSGQTHGKDTGPTQQNQQTLESLQTPAKVQPKISDESFVTVEEEKYLTSKNSFASSKVVLKEQDGANTAEKQKEMEQLEKKEKDTKPFYVTNQEIITAENLPGQIQFSIEKQTKPFHSASHGHISAQNLPAFIPKQSKPVNTSGHDAQNSKDQIYLAKEMQTKPYHEDTKDLNSSSHNFPDVQLSAKKESKISPAHEQDDISAENLQGQFQFAKEKQTKPNNKDDKDFVSAQNCNRKLTLLSLVSNYALLGGWCTKRALTLGNK